MGTKLVARIVSLQVGLPRVVEVVDDNSFKGVWTTGFFKEEVTDPVWLGSLNLAGDGQADLENHGGFDKAVNIYPLQHYSYWRQNFSLPELRPGAFGENFTMDGMTECEVCIGDIFEVGDSLVQVSQPRQPCWKLARRWGIRDLAIRFQDTGLTGWYVRVLREGRVRVKDEMVLVQRPYPQWTVAAANRVMHLQTEDRGAAQELANCPALSARWRIKLNKRAATGKAENTFARLYGANDESS